MHYLPALQQAPPLVYYLRLTRARKPVDKLSRSLADLKERVLDRAKEGLERLVETGKDYAGKAADTYSSAKDELKEKAVALKEDAKDSAIDTIERA